MSRRVDRREFLARAATVGAIASGYFINPAKAAESKSPNEKLNLAAVGVAGKGGDNINQLKSQNIVALCDVDSNYLDRAAMAHPEARKYRDYRKMLEAEVNKIDGVIVSTADHTHAPATSVALDLGKPVYCEKPLTHTVEEARAIAKLAAKKKVATQMGTQVHAGGNYRRVVEVIQSGAIGPVTEVYNWCNKDWGGGTFSTQDTPVPSNLDWDLWLGPAKSRPYSTGIHPANWRRFWEYGSGTFGDMAAHVMDLPFWALGLRHPTAVVAEGPEVHPDGAPSWCKAQYDFPARGEQPAVKFHWSDGGAHHDLVKETTGRNMKPLASWGLGVLFVGSKGMLAADYGHYELFPQDKFADFKPPEKSIPDSIGHWNEWVEAIKTGSPTTCNFDYSGALTETILLGIVAFRAGKRLEWNAEQLKATNAPEAERFVRKEYRKGFEVVGIG
jgi:predicted dehydrogenase